jgi:RNA polymerase-binding transcription factor DksA
MIDTQHFKELLSKECDVLEQELATVGKKNPEKKGDWVPVESEHDTDAADEGEVADTIDNLEGNTAILDQLETRLAEVREALQTIEKGTYGKCIVCNMEIESDRLDANPAAKTCKMHMSL